MVRVKFDQKVAATFWSSFGFCDLTECGKNFTHLMRRSLLWFILVLSIVGAGVSLLATHQYFQILEKGFEEKSFCNISELINCDLAYASSYAKFANIPVSWVGFIFYLWTFVLALLTLYKKESKEAVASFGWVLSLIALAVSLYKAYIATLVLKVVCLLCLSMYAVNLLIFVGWHFFLRGRFRLQEHLTLRPKFAQFTVLTLVLFGLGWGIMSSYQTKFLKNAPLAIPVSEILPYHFRQSQYDFTPDLKNPVWGNPNAAVTVIEFSDFQCPFCKEAAFHLKPMLSEFKDKVRLYFYNYPINKDCNDHIPQSFHENACIAAQASICAAKMGDFWGYHDDIFRNQKDLTRDLLIQLAKNRGWNEKEFIDCLESPETRAHVKADVEAGNKIYVNGTPTVLVNNRRVKYWNDPEIFHAIIRAEIAKTRAR